MPVYGVKMKLVQFLSVLFCVLSLSNPSHADNLIPYYGDEFYSHPGARDEQLISLLSKVLESKHQFVPGKMDRIVSACEPGSRCYAQTSLGYSGVKAFLLSRYYVVTTGAGSSITDVYCEKDYSVPGPVAVPNPAILNIEHTWPQSRFTGKYSKDLQKADAHHLFPSDSEINSVRGNYPFGEVVRDQKVLKCNVSRFGQSANPGQLVFEPPVRHRGNVARALFYFSVRYHMPIDTQQEAFLKDWHKRDPVDQEEMNRNNEVFKVQGNRNPFVDMPYLVEQIRNF